MKKIYIKNFYKFTLYLIFLLFSSYSYAHHPMGGGLPNNFLNGFFSGIGHPVIGFDHLAFILTFGIISSYYENKIIIPLTFVTLSLFGTLISVNFFVIPFSELIISLSIIIAGLIVINERKINIYFPITLAVTGGLFHGYAFGQSVVGIESTPLIAYLIGIASIPIFLGLVINPQKIMDYLPQYFENLINFSYFQENIVVNFSIILIFIFASKNLYLFIVSFLFSLCCTCCFIYTKLVFTHFNINNMNIFIFIKIWHQSFLCAFKIRR